MSAFEREYSLQPRSWILVGAFLLPSSYSLAHAFQMINMNNWQKNLTLLLEPSEFVFMLNRSPILTRNWRISQTLIHHLFFLNELIFCPFPRLLSSDLKYKKILPTKIYFARTFTILKIYNLVATFYKSRTFEQRRSAQVSVTEKSASRRCR